ncbi:MAG: DUF885 domain-containing protein, partial [Rubrivivax sp.]
PEADPRRRCLLALPLALCAVPSAWAAAAGPASAARSASVAASASASASVAAAAAAAAATSFSTWADAFAAEWVRQSPERATYSQYFEGAEQAALERRLTPQTSAQRNAQRTLARRGLARLARFDTRQLTASERVGHATLRWSLQQSVAGAPFEDHSFAFTQLYGPQVSLVSFLTQTHPMRNAADVDAFQARLEGVPLRLDEAIVRARVAAAKGLLPPRFILERAQTQVQTFLKPAAADNVLVAALARRSAEIQGLSDSDRKQAVERATQTVQNRLLPAWRRVDTFLAELHPRTDDRAGLWRLPYGQAAYAQALAQYTTTTLDAETIHAIGLREVARIEAQMDAVFTKLGQTEGSVESRMEALRQQLQPPAEPDPRPGLIALHEQYVADAQKRSQALFNLQPKAPVVVKREPPLTEKTAAAHYNAPAPDGSRPGTFWVPLSGPDFNIPAMRSLAVHEAVPGHHFQIALQQEETDLPRWRQRRIFSGGSANSEGWALYAERLAIDEGWYADDPHALLGALSSQLFRARRLVVDTGLHAKRWTRQQAIDYGIGAQEVERYVANPGQATAYMIGMLHILQLRAGAQQRLGERFTLQGFHDVVLKAGSVPLAVLTEVVQQWSV